MTRPIPAIAVKFIEREEGERYKAYRDVGGAWTDGVGHTQGVGPDSVVNQAQIDANLAADLQIDANRLVAAVGSRTVANLTEYQYAALLSFVFNEGAGVTWGIWGAVKAGDSAGVARELARFIYVRKTINQGLVNRRTAETALWNGTDPLCKS